MRAIHMLNDTTIEQIAVDEVTYFHILFDTHQIVFSEGLPSESLFPGEVAKFGLNDAALKEVYALFPELKAATKRGLKTVVPVLRRFEAEVFLST